MSGKSNIRPRLIFFALLLLMVGLGYLRDFFFVHLNARLGYLWYEMDDSYYTPQGEAMFGGFSYYTLYYSKFIFTVLCSLVYGILTWGLARTLLPKLKSRNIIFIIYGGLTVFSFLVFMLGHALGMAHDFYGLSRYLMGFVQSPVLSVMTLVFLMLYTGHYRAYFGEK